MNIFALRRKIAERAGFAYEISETVCVSVFAAFLIKTFIIASYFIPSPSMENTLQVNDRIIAVKSIIAGNTPDYGDIVIFRYPLNQDVYYVKRVVGLPGDSLLVQDGKLYRNNISCREEYLKESYIHGDFGPITVKQGEIFVMGDNRNHSSDSRFFGAVSLNLVEAYPLFRYWPPSRAGSIKNTSSSRTALTR